MCFDADARPPLPPVAGGALDSSRLVLTAADGNRLAAFAARAERPSGAAIVVLPDVRGLHAYYEELALRLAEAGVHAVAIDPYGRTAGGERRGEGFDPEPHVRQLTADGVAADVAAALAHLRFGESGRVERTFTLGFCVGGRMSLLQAAAGHGLSGVIGFYPWPVGEHRSGLPAPADRAREFGCPVLVLYGGGDPGIPADAVATFDRALDAAGVRRRTVVYEGAPHSFFDRRAAEHAEASTDAWRQVLDFAGVSAT
ncbi:MAG TPA: dienelactone hydrolase family protein [Candidatus Limnocylindria bacterium]|nr:dienelactone hydrolase family protein [Candidatus Limnocylindria bacterium]